jgi:hypothetical protein
MPITRPGEGTILMLKIASTFTEIAEVHEIDGPEMTVAAIAKTALTSPHKRYRSSRQPDPGTISLKLYFDPNDTTDVHQLLYSKVAQPNTVNDDFKLVFVDDMTVPAHALFSGFFTKFKLTGMTTEDANLEAECEIQLDSLPVFTEGAAS